MAEFKMNLDGVSAAGVSTYVDPGEYVARITSTGVEETQYGNAVRFNTQILEENDEGKHKGARLDTLLYIPDDVMEKKTSSHDKAKKKPDWSKNFMELMAGKWVSLLQATGFAEKVKDGVDARAIAKAVVGKELLIVVQDSKKRKPTDPVFSQINGFLPLEDREAKGVDLDSEDDTAEDDEFDLDEL